MIERATAVGICVPVNSNPHPTTIMRKLQFALFAAIIFCCGCSVIYRETTFDCRTQADGWVQTDSADRYGRFKVEFKTDDIYLRTNGLFLRTYHGERFGPPIFPIFGVVHNLDDEPQSTSLAIFISSSKDSLAFDLSKAFVRLADDSIFYPVDWSTHEVAHSTKDIMVGLKFAGQFLKADSLSLNLGEIMVGSRKIQLPVMMYDRHLSRHYYPFTFIAN